MASWKEWRFMSWQEEQARKEALFNRLALRCPQCGNLLQYGDRIEREPAAGITEPYWVGYCDPCRIAGRDDAPVFAVADKMTSAELAKIDHALQQAGMKLRDATDALIAVKEFIDQ